MQEKKCFVVGVSGGSASGKTELIKKLKNAFSENEATFVAMDNYYFPKEKQKRDAQGKINFDHPDAVNLDKLYLDLLKLMQGETLTVTQYNYNNPDLPTPEITYVPNPIIIVEGIFLFFHPQINSLLDLRVFVDADEHIKLARRIRRDTLERGYTLENILEQYKEHVVPMYRKFIEPYKYESDILIPNNHQMDRGIAVLTGYLKTKLKEFSF